MTLVAKDGRARRSAAIRLDVPASAAPALRRPAGAARSSSSGRSLPRTANAAGTVADALDAITIASRRGRLMNVGDSSCDSARPIGGSSRRVTMTCCVRSSTHPVDDSRSGSRTATCRWRRRNCARRGRALPGARERGVRTEELSELTQEREAMQAVPAGYGRRAPAQPGTGGGAAQPGRGERRSARRDLERMLDQIENLAKNGARDVAQPAPQRVAEYAGEISQGARPMQGDQPGERDDAEPQRTRRDDPEAAAAHGRDLPRRSRRRKGRPVGSPRTQEELEQALRDLQQGQAGLSSR